MAKLGVGGASSSREPQPPGPAAGAEIRPSRLGCAARFRESLDSAVRRRDPFIHWLTQATFPKAVIDGLAALPFRAPPPQPGDGTREGRNESRRYVDPPAIRRFSVCRVLAEALQAEPAVRHIEAVTGADLGGTFLRLELALDVEGFWLKPHTDLGVKRFTLLCYLAPQGQDDLGTDLYSAPDRWVARTPFAPGAALAFVPGQDTWHGFEPRPIRGVRKSLIVNYVTDAWRAREQLAFPEAPVRGSRAA